MEEKQKDALKLTVVTHEEAAALGEKIIALGFKLAKLRAQRDELLEATTTFVAWLNHEDVSLKPWDSVGRDSPEGERLWQEWWNQSLALCARARDQGRAAIAKARKDR